MRGLSAFQTAGMAGSRHVDEIGDRPSLTRGVRAKRILLRASLRCLGDIIANDTEEAVSQHLHDTVDQPDGRARSVTRKPARS